MEWTSDTPYNMDKPSKHYAKWNMLYTTKYGMSPLIWNRYNIQIHRERKIDEWLPENKGRGNGK